MTKEIAAARKGWTEENRMRDLDKGKYKGNRTPSPTPPRRPAPALPPAPPPPPLSPLPALSAPASVAERKSSTAQSPVGQEVPDLPPSLPLRTHPSDVMFRTVLAVQWCTSSSSGEEERWDHRPAWAFKNGKPWGPVEAGRRDNNLQATCQHGFAHEGRSGEWNK